LIGIDRWSEIFTGLLAQSIKEVLRDMRACTSERDRVDGIGAIGT
jgi:hypothetical protein